MKRCCFCFNARSGALATAISNLVLKFVTIIGLAVWYYDLRPVLLRRINTYNSSYYTRELLMIDAGFYTAIVFCSISFISCILVIAGVKKEKRGLFWPWLITTGLEILVGFIMICVFFIMWDYMARACIVGVGIVTFFQGYCFRCVAAHYRNLNKTANNNREMAVDFSYKHMKSVYDDDQSSLQTVNVQSQESMPSYLSNPPDYSAFNDVKANPNNL